MDRLAELRKGSEHHDEIPMGANISTPFFTLSDEIKRDLDTIDINSVSQQSIKNKLTTVKKKIVELERMKVATEYSQVKQNLVDFTKDKFKTKFEAFCGKQVEEKKKKEKEIRKQIYITSPTISDEDMLKAIKNPSDFLRAKIMTNESDSRILGAFELAKSKYSEVLQLEADIAELHQMFFDFAHITAKQGEILDDIESQVIEASEYVDQGNGALREAARLLCELRKKQCCCIAIVLTVLLVIVAIIVIVVYVGKAHIG